MTEPYEKDRKRAKGRTSVQTFDSLAQPSLDALLFHVFSLQSNVLIFSGLSVTLYLAAIIFEVYLFRVSIALIAFRFASIICSILRLSSVFCLNKLAFHSNYKRVHSLYCGLQLLFTFLATLASENNAKDALSFSFEPTEQIIPAGSPYSDSIFMFCIFILFASSELTFSHVLFASLPSMLAHLIFAMINTSSSFPYLLSSVVFLLLGFLVAIGLHVHYYALYSEGVMRFLLHRHESARLMRLLERILPNEVRDILLSKKKAFMSRAPQAVVMCAGIVNWREITSEGSLFTIMARIVHFHTIVSRMVERAVPVGKCFLLYPSGVGQQTFVVFAMDAANSDDWKATNGALRAIRCAEMIQREFHRLQKEGLSHKVVPSIGIHTGALSMGMVGKDTLRLQATGRVLLGAQQVQYASHAGRVVMTVPVFRLLADRNDKGVMIVVNDVGYLLDSDCLPNMVIKPYSCLSATDGHMVRLYHAELPTRQDAKIVQEALHSAPSTAHPTGAADLEGPDTLHRNPSVGGKSHTEMKVRRPSLTAVATANAANAAGSERAKRRSTSQVIGDPTGLARSASGNRHVYQPPNRGQSLRQMSAKRVAEKRRHSVSVAAAHNQLQGQRPRSASDTNNGNPTDPAGQILMDSHENLKSTARPVVPTLAPSGTDFSTLIQSRAAGDWRPQTGRDFELEPATYREGMQGPSFLEADSGAWTDRDHLSRSSSVHSIARSEGSHNGSARHSTRSNFSTHSGTSSLNGGGGEYSGGEAVEFEVLEEESEDGHTREGKGKPRGRSKQAKRPSTEFAPTPQPEKEEKRRRKQRKAWKRELTPAEIEKSQSVEMDNASLFSLLNYDPKAAFMTGDQMGSKNLLMGVTPTPGATPISTAELPLLAHALPDSNHFTLSLTTAYTPKSVSSSLASTKDDGVVFKATDFQKLEMSPSGFDFVRVKEDADSLDQLQHIELLHQTYCALFSYHQAVRLLLVVGCVAVASAFSFDTLSTVFHLLLSAASFLSALFLSLWLNPQKVPATRSMAHAATLTVAYLALCGVVLVVTALGVFASIDDANEHDEPFESLTLALSGNGLPLSLLTTFLPLTVYGSRYIHFTAQTLAAALLVLSFLLTSPDAFSLHVLYRAVLVAFGALFALVLYYLHDTRARRGFLDSHNAEKYRQTSLELLCAVMPRVAALSVAGKPANTFHKTLLSHSNIKLPPFLMGPPKIDFSIKSVIDLESSGIFLPPVPTLSSSSGPTLYQYIPDGVVLKLHIQESTRTINSLRASAATQLMGELEHFIEMAIQLTLLTFPHAENDYVICSQGWVLGSHMLFCTRRDNTPKSIISELSYTRSAFVRSTVTVNMSLEETVLATPPSPLESVELNPAFLLAHVFSSVITTLTEFNRKNVAKGLPVVQIKAGMAKGPLFSCIASVTPRHLLLGHCVEFADELHYNAPANGTYMDEATYRGVDVALLRGDWTVDQMPHKLKERLMNTQGSYCRANVTHATPVYRLSKALPSRGPLGRKRRMVDDARKTSLLRNENVEGPEEPGDTLFLSFPAFPNFSSDYTGSINIVDVMMEAQLSRRAVRTRLPPKAKPQLRPYPLSTSSSAGPAAKAPSSRPPANATPTGPNAAPPRPAYAHSHSSSSSSHQSRRTGKPPPRPAPSTTSTGRNRSVRRV